MAVYLNYKIKSVDNPIMNVNFPLRIIVTVGILGLGISVLLRKKRKV